MNKLRLIKAVVFILTFLLVFGSLMVLTKLYHLSRKTPIELPTEISLQEKDGHISQILENNGQLQILVKDEKSGDKIILFDLNSGQKLSTITLK